MARKKQVELIDVPTAETVEAQPKPRAKRATKKPEAAEPAPLAPVETPAVEAKPRRRTAKKADSPVEAPLEAPVEEVKAEEAPVKEAAAKTARPSRTRKPAVKAVQPEATPETEAPIEGDLVVSFRPRPGAAKREQKAAARPAAPPPVAPRASALDEIDFAALDFPVPVFRARGAGPEPVSPEETETSEAAEPRSRSRRGRGRRGNGRGSTEESPVAASAETSAEVVAEPEPELPREETADDSEDFAIVTLLWRARSTRPLPTSSEGEEASGEEEGESRDRSGRRRRRGRGRDRQPELAADAESSPSFEAEDVEDDFAPSVPAAPVIPPAPKRMTVEIPAEAPQVVLRDGLPTLVRRHRVYPPILFFGNPEDGRRAEQVFEEMRLAAEAGVHLHSVMLTLVVDPDEVAATVRKAEQLLERVLRADRDAQLLFRVVFVPPFGWEDKFGNAVYRRPDGSPASPSLCDDKFWGIAEDCLAEFARALRALPDRDHVLGIQLERDEWVQREESGYDTSYACLRKFRDWAKKRYLEDEVTLRASWFDGHASFDSIRIPEYRPEGTGSDWFVRSSRKQRRYVDYQLFLSDATVQRIGDLAYAVKKASEGMLLVGCNYGYTFEWSHPNSGHLSLGKLLRTPEIDFIAGPPSYRNREPGGAAPFPGPIDSIALNGKLFISEEDFKTTLSIDRETDDTNPIMRTPQALENAHWRGAGAAFAHGGGVNWMDLWGNGWLKSHAIWDRAAAIADALVHRMAAPLADPDVAVFVDERALAYLVDPDAFTMLVQNVRESMLRAGVSAGFYLLSDLQHREHFPEAKLYLFLNAWDIQPGLRAAIKSRLQRDNKVLFWLYAAGLFDSGRESLERAREVTGIALKPQPFHSRAGTTILNRRHPLAEAFPDRSLIGGTKLEPSYFAIPEEAQVLGEYSQTGLPSFVVREFGEGDPETRWTSVFLGEPTVNPALIRALATMAGAHVWSHVNDVVHVSEPFLTVHCAGTGNRVVTLPANYSAFNLVSREWVVVDSNKLAFHGLDGSTQSFLVGGRADIETILRTTPASLLRIENLPPREANVLGDIYHFDVPTIKLGDWIEGSDNDEVADEWFLRAPQPVEEVEVATSEPDMPGRRRRRRRRGGREGGPRENGGSYDSDPTGEAMAVRAEDEDVSMNVVFRKRD